MKALEFEGSVRVSAAWALWRIERKAEQVVPYLVGELRNGSSWIQHRAVEKLGAIGSPSRSAVAELRNLQRETRDRRLRDRITDALERIHRTSP